MVLREDSIFRRFSFRFTLWWVIAPNLGAIAMWAVGGPSMAFPMAVCGLLAVIFCHFDNVLTRRMGVLACCILSTLMYIACSFNLSGYKILTSLPLFLELDPASSPEYLAAGAVVLIAMILACRYAPTAPRLSRNDQRIMAAVAVALLINVDSVATAGTRGSYKVTPEPGTPIDSAMLQNRITPTSVHARNLIVIIVESLGQPVKGYDRSLFDRAWGAQRWTTRYKVEHGTTKFFGSTTNAAIREWCGEWSDYDRVDFAARKCLPTAFHDAGFSTTSIHAFDGSFFDREHWHRDIGFGDSLFKADLIAHGASRCGGVFPGACDTDIPRIIGQRLKASRQPRNLIYWLTLNTHLPVPRLDSLHTTRCDTGNPKWDARFPMLCRSYTLQQRLADAIVREVMKPDFPEADILIVGDHMPPFSPRALRTRYDPTAVPWIMLRNRAAMERGGAAVATR